MKKELTVTGLTVQEAIDDGAVQLGADRDDISYEIISLPKKSFFGMKSQPAKVRVWIGEDEVPAQAKTAPAPAKAAPASPPVQKAPAQSAPKPNPQADRPRPQNNFPAFKPRDSKIHTINEADRAMEPAAPPKPRVLTTPAPDNEKVNAAKEYLGQLISAMGMTAVITASLEDNDNLILELEGDDLGVLIGRRGETLDSLQYLVGLVANRFGGSYMRVTINSGDFREKREKALEGLARKVAANVVRSGRSASLEPMNPYERRIIHATIQNIDGVTSSSTGDGPNRRVIVSSTNPRPAGDRPDRDNRGDRRFSDRRPGGDRGDRPRGGDRDRRDDRRPGGRRDDRRSDRGDRPPSVTVRSADAGPIKDDETERPLYSKIDI